MADLQYDSSDPISIQQGWLDVVTDYLEENEIGVSDDVLDQWRVLIAIGVKNIVNNNYLGNDEVIEQAHESLSRVADTALRLSPSRDRITPRSFSQAVYQEWCGIPPIC